MSQLYRDPQQNHYRTGVKVLPTYAQSQNVRLFRQTESNGLEHYSNDNYSRLVRGKWQSWAQLMNERKDLPEPLNVAKLNGFTSLYNLPSNNSNGHVLTSYENSNPAFVNNSVPTVKFQGRSVETVYPYVESPDLSLNGSSHLRKKKLTIGIIIAFLILLSVASTATLVKLFADSKLEFRFALLDNYRIASLLVTISRSGVQLILTGSSLLAQITSVFDFDTKFIVHWSGNDSDFCFVTFLNETAFPSTLSLIASCKEAETRALSLHWNEDFYWTVEAIPARLRGDYPSEPSSCQRLFLVQRSEKSQSDMICSGCTKVCLPAYQTAEVKPANRIALFLTIARRDCFFIPRITPKIT